MHHRRLGPSLALLAVLLPLAVSVRTDAQAPVHEKPSLSLVGAPGPLKPGGVALLTFEGTRDFQELSGEMSGRPVRFWSPAPRRWQGLVGIGLDSTAGEQTLSVQGRSTDGTIAATVVPLVIASHRFETRRLRVDPKMVNPPAAELARIKEEAKAMADAFAILTPQRLWQGRFDAPVPGSATSSFGRLTVTNGTPAGRHQGADFRAGSGTPVRAPNGGRVVLAQSLYFAGNTVIVDHGLGVFSLLAHLSRIDVEAGAMVARGDVLGVSGATGRVTGPHLHWAVRFGEMSVDPLGLMAAVADLADEAIPPVSH